LPPRGHVRGGKKRKSKEDREEQPDQGEWRMGLDDDEEDLAVQEQAKRPSPHASSASSASPKKQRTKASGRGRTADPSPSAPKHTPAMQAAYKSMGIPTDRTMWSDMQDDDEDDAPPTPVAATTPRLVPASSLSAIRSPSTPIPSTPTRVTSTNMAKGGTAIAHSNQRRLSFSSSTPPARRNIASK
jgi:hypothetical protein